MEVNIISINSPNHRIRLEIYEKINLWDKLIDHLFIPIILGTVISASIQFSLQLAIQSHDNLIQ